MTFSQNEDFVPDVYNEMLQSVKDRNVNKHRYAKCVVSRDGSLITEAKFPIKDGLKFIRLTVTDEKGKVACTNAYFADEIYENKGEQ